MNKLTRAGKKKLKNLLKLGLSMKKARQQLERCNYMKSKFLRTHPKNLWPTEGDIKLAIIPLGFPQVLLTTQQLQDIETAILQSIVEQRDGNIKPLFGGSKFRPGWMTITCRDSITAEWLEAEVGTLQIMPGNIDLLTMPDSAIPKTEVFVGYFPIGQCGDDPDVILALLGGQNEGLRVSDWRVYHRKPKGAAGVQMAIALDPQSAAQVRHMDYRLSFSFGEITLMPSRKTAKSNAWSQFFGIEVDDGHQELLESSNLQDQLEDDWYNNYSLDKGFEDFNDDSLFCHFNDNFKNFSEGFQNFDFEFNFSNNENKLWKQDHEMPLSSTWISEGDGEPNWNCH